MGHGLGSSRIRRLHGLKGARPRPPRQEAWWAGSVASATLGVEVFTEFGLTADNMDPLDLLALQAAADPEAFEDIQTVVFTTCARAAFIENYTDQGWSRQDAECLVDGLFADAVMREVFFDPDIADNPEFVSHLEGILRQCLPDEAAETIIAGLQGSTETEYEALSRASPEPSTPTSQTPSSPKIDWTP